VGALRESGEIPRAVVISFDAEIVLNLRKIEPTLMTGLLYDGQLENPLEKAVAIGARQIGGTRRSGDAGAARQCPEKRSASGVLDGKSFRAHADARRPQEWTES